MEGEPTWVPGQWAEIQSGLSPGELVVVGPGADLHDGQKVRYQLVADTESPETKAQTATNQPRQIPEWVSLKALDGWIADLVEADRVRHVDLQATLGSPGGQRLRSLARRETGPPQSQQTPVKSVCY